jgi:uncharacterized membrane protein
MTDQLVADYLGRLERAAAVLPPERRGELLEEIGAHITAARAAGAAADEAAVRTLLDRLGEPEVIVAAAREDVPTSAEAAVGPSLPARRGTGLELAAVLMLTLGSLFPPLVGWLVGVVLLWVSPLWRVREKLLGTLVWPGGPGGALLLGGVLTAGVGFGDEQCRTVAGTTTCTSGELVPVEGLPLLAVFLPPLLVAVLLYRVARRRADQVVPPVVATPAPWGGLEVTGVLLLGLGGLVLPLVPSLVGLVLVLSSRAWTRREKAVGALLVATPLLLAVGSLGAFYLSSGAYAIGPAEVGLLGGYVGLLLGPLIGAGWFFARLQRRR